MTPGPQLDIDAIEARTEAATAGPWEAVHVDDGQFYGQPPTFDIWSTDGGRSETVVTGGPAEDGGPTLGAVELQDAAFISNARTDVPELCAEVRQLREQLAWEKSINDGLALQQEGWEDWSNTLASLLPESYDGDAAQEAIIERFVRDSVAALGAAVTPTPQDDEDAAILAAFKAECDKVGVPYDPAGLVRHHRRNAEMAAGAWKLTAEHLQSKLDDLARPVTSTPEAPTEATMTCTAAANIKGEHIPCDLNAPHGGWAHSNREHELIWDGPSGLQRATEQQR